MIFAPNTEAVEVMSPFLSRAVKEKELLPDPLSSPKCDKSTVHLRGSTFAAIHRLLALLNGVLMCYVVWEDLLRG